MNVDFSVAQYPGGRWRANSYLVRSSDDRVLIIDPGAGVADVIRDLGADTRRVEAILCTHGHHDHVEAGALAKGATRAPLLIHAADLHLLRAASLYRRLFDGQGPVPTPSVDAFLVEGPEPLVLGPFVVHVIEAPGHTTGSVLLRLESCLFTGDTLLPNTVGRTDLPGGDTHSLDRTLSMIMRMPRELRVFPGHRLPTTIGDELDTNPRLLALRDGNGAFASAGSEP